MKLKTLSVCVAVLAIISVIVFLANRPPAPTPPDPRVGKPLVDVSIAQKATAVRITDQGKTVSVGRDAQGLWVVDSYYGLPVDFQKLSQFMNDLVSAKVDRFVTASPERLGRLEFKDTQIQLLDSSKNALFSLTLGKTPDSGTGRFVQFTGETKAFQTSLNAWIDADPKNWADPQLLTLKDTDIAKVSATVEGKTYLFTRAKAGDEWACADMPKGDKLHQEKLAGLISSLGSIRFTDSSDLSDPAVAIAQAHAQSVTFTQFDGKSFEVTLGRKPEEKKLKAPTADPKGVTGLGKLSDADKAKPDEKKAAAPEFDTIPAGPVYVWIKASDPKDRVNGEMAKRAFQTDDTLFSMLPSKLDEFFEAPAPATKPDSAAVPSAPAPAPAGEATPKADK